jgi:hypothetical protein
MSKHQKFSNKIIAVSVFGISLLLLAYFLSNKLSSRGQDINNRTTAINKKKFTADQASKGSQSDAVFEKIDPTFVKKGSFMVALPPVELERVKANFFSESVLDGQLIDVSYADIYEAFKSGNSFEIPLLEGKTAVARPVKVTQNQGGLVTFTASTDLKSTNGLQPQDEALLVFMSQRLLSGHVFSEGIRYEISQGGDGVFLLKRNPASKID